MSLKLTFTCDERDEFANAFLHALFRLLRYLGVLRQRVLHNPSHWSKVANVSIVRIVSVGFAVAVRGRGSALRFGRLGRRIAPRHRRRFGEYASVSSLGSSSSSRLKPRTQQTAGNQSKNSIGLWSLSRLCKAAPHPTVTGPTKDES